MKHIKKILAIVAMTSAAVMSFAACGGEGDVPDEHEHTFKTTWEYDEQTHWHAASCEHDWLKSGEAAHVFTETKEGEETCTEGATVTRTCSCGYSYTYQTEPLGHNYQPVEGTAASCEEGGVSDYQQCTRCHDIIGKKDIEPLGHNYHLEPILDEQGKETDQHHEVCGICGDVKEGSEADHEYAEDVYEHDAKGHWQVCACGHKTEVQNHNTEGDVKFDETHHWATCQVCGEAAADKTEHNWADVVEEQAATCTEAGHSEYKECLDCGYKLGYEEYPALGHDYQVMSDDEGHHWQHCDHENCSAPDTEKVPHNFGTEYLSDGTQHWQKCTVCGKEGEKAAHTHNEEIYDHDGTQHWLLCDVCGEPSATKTNHSFDPTTGQCACGAVTSETKDFFTYEQQGTSYIVTGLDEDAIKAEATAPTAFAIPAQRAGRDVVAIAAGAFMGNTTMTQIAIPASVTTIGDFAFQGCTALTKVTFAAGSKLAELGTFDYQVFNGCTNLKEIALPAGVTVLGGNTFKGCAKLDTVTLAGNMTKIDTQAFYGCTALTALTVKGELSYIGQKAFANSGIETLTFAIAQGGRIAQGAFEGCASLTALTVTGGITYFASPILAGCSKLTTLTLPFVGDNVDPAKGTDFHFGYIFGKKAEGGYNIPTTLTTLTVNGGVVKSGAFDNCGKLNITAADDVDVETKKFEDYTGTFTWNGTFPKPELTDVTVDKNSGEYELTVELTYTAGANAESVSVKVMKGDAEAARDTDYTVVEEGKKYTLKTDGTFTFVVTATGEGGDTAKKSPAVTVTKPAPHFEKVEVTGETYADGKCELNKELTLTATVQGDDTALTYTVKKGGEDATANTDYTASVNKNVITITFETAGNYTVTVTATRNGLQETKSVEIQVTDPSAAKPVITEFKLGEGTTELTEGDAAQNLNVTATYEGTAADTMEFKVLVKNGGNFEDAPEANYKVEGDATKTFRALLAGEYKIEVTVTAENGNSVNGEITVNVKPVELELALAAQQTATQTNGWYRVAKNTETTFTYTVGTATYLDGYNVTYGKTIDTANIEAGAEKSVKVNLDDVNTVTYTVVYTHKTVVDKSFTLSIPVSYVSDLANSPVLGEDPFGGTYGELISATALQLYWNVTDKATEGTQLPLADISYEIVDGSNTTGVSATTAHIADNAQFPYYVLIEDWVAGNATGEVAVKLTATKDGQTAAATKVFKVNTLADPNNPKGVNEYAQKVMGEKSKDMNFDIIMERGNRENIAFTKDGIVEHRSGAGGWGPQANIFCAEPHLADNFQIDFDFTIYGRDNGGKVALTVNFRTGNFNGWSNDFYLESNNNAANISIYGGGNGYGTQSWENNSYGVDGKPGATVGSVTHVRMKHSVAEGNVTFECTWSTDGENYYPWWTFVTASSTDQGNVASPVEAIQFRHNAGCFGITNFTLTVNN